MALANDDGKIVTEQLGDKFETFPVRMAFQAGYAQFEDWTSGTTFHCGIGYFHPFGQCKYYMGEFDMAEAAGFPISDLFTEKFSEDFCDMGFAIYRLPDGDIYCYDGIFGTLKSSPAREAVKVADASEVHTGPAVILANIDGTEVLEYCVRIEKLYPQAENGRNLLITVTDEQLLEKTGGIVQGMSGSPILQNGKLIGAVTHVLVNRPEQGYGVFMETMLSQCQAYQ